MSFWPTTRILFLLAGTMTLLSALLAATVSPWWLLLTTLIGTNQLMFTAVGFCPASLILERLRGGRTGTVACSTQEA